MKWSYGRRLPKVNHGYYADNTDESMIHEALSRDIIRAAMVVLNELKPGLDEKLYERAMIIELKHCGHSVSVQSCLSLLIRAIRG